MGRCTKVYKNIPDLEAACHAVDRCKLGVLLLCGWVIWQLHNRGAKLKIDLLWSLLLIDYSSDHAKCLIVFSAPSLFLLLTRSVNSSRPASLRTFCVGLGVLSLLGLPMGLSCSLLFQPPSLHGTHPYDSNI